LSPIGIPELTVHPMHLIPAEVLELVPLWYAWRGGDMAAGHLPFAGGAADQPALLMACFGIMNTALAAIKPKER
jgi:hypothetical protein